eukprot:8945910-Pyramimonas_sp.AAC.1
MQGWADGLPAQRAQARPADTTAQPGGAGGGQGQAGGGPFRTDCKYYLGLAGRRSKKGTANHICEDGCDRRARRTNCQGQTLSLIHISEPTRPEPI